MGTSGRHQVVAIVVALVGLLGSGCEAIVRRLADCGGRSTCADEGRCATSLVFAGDAPARCYAASDRDCEASAVCRDEGRCVAHGDGTCVRPEAAVDPTTHCATSVGCAVQGRCSPFEGSCRAELDEHCRASTMCVTEGRCQPYNGVCIVRSARDCEDSLGCAALGRCDFDEPPFYVAGGACTGGQPEPPPVPKAETSVGPANPPARQRATAEPKAPEPAGPTTRAIEIACRGVTLRGSTPAAWVSTPSADPACPAVWRLSPKDGSSDAPDAAWLVARCSSPEPVGIRMVDTWYGRLRRPDGRPLPELGTGRASLTTIADMAATTIEARGTLVDPIACAAIDLPLIDAIVHTTALAGPRATFVFELVGPAATVEARHPEARAFVDGLRGQP